MASRICNNRRLRSVTARWGRTWLPSSHLLSLLILSLRSPEASAGPGELRSIQSPGTQNSGCRSPPRRHLSNCLVTTAPWLQEEPTSPGMEPSLRQFADT